MGEERRYLPTGILPDFLGLVTLLEVAELLFQPGHLHAMAEKVLIVTS